MISIIIPMYNAEKYIARCLDSVLAQTYTDWEVIIVDDGSTDRSLRICRGYEERDERINWRSQRNRGVGSARNIGMKIAKGESIFFLDADDYLLPYTLDTFYKAWVENHFPIIVGSVVRVSPKGVLRNENLYFLYPELWKGPEKWHWIGYADRNGITEHVWDYLKTHNDYIISHCWGRLYERGFLECHNLQFPEGVKVGEDGAFNIRCLVYADCIMIINEPLYCFQIHKDSSSVVAINNDLLDLKPLQDALIDYFSSRVKASIIDLEKVTIAWGKKNG